MPELIFYKHQHHHVNSVSPLTVIRQSHGVFLIGIHMMTFPSAPFAIPMSFPACTIGPGGVGVEIGSK